MKSDQQIRHELSLLRKQLRERKKQRLGIPRKSVSYFRKDHEYLETGIEKTRRRIEIFRAAGGEVAWFDEADPGTIEEIRPATCQGCVEPHLIGWEEGEWHHNVKSHGGKRCDCARCGAFLCHMIHEQYRNRVVPIIQREAVKPAPAEQPTDL